MEMIEIPRFTICAHCGVTNVVGETDDHAKGCVHERKDDDGRSTDAS